MMFHHPSIWFLLLLLLLPGLYWRLARNWRRSAVAFSSIETASRAPRTWAIRLRWIVPTLRILALVLLIICMARPRKADEQTRIHTEGIAIQLVVDRSGSMRAMDFTIDGKPADRLAAVRKVVEEFVIGSGDLPGRPDDLVGLITFATFCDSISPPTLDHDYLIESIRQTTVAGEEEGASTAIGDALALGVERLRSLVERADLTARPAIKSKVMILLSDGEDNSGEIDPITAAEMAAAFDIKVYTIGAGSRNSTVEVPFTDPFTGREVMRRVPVSIDEETLRKIAQTTGGEYFRATDTDSLTEIYSRIDELERTDIEQRRYTRYGELAVEPLRIGSATLPPLLIIVFALISLELLLSNTRFRTL
ncbi:MAG: VWA domain-containing protein [Phycisphaerales bacterium]|nr:MAG: VWA domain-containing protein [Phycisphaerales bacterium]